MRIQTKDFGELEIKAENIITFPQGIKAFEDIKDYVLLNYDFSLDDSPIKCLQSLSGQVSFTVVDPFCFLPEYNPVLNSKDKAIIGAADEKKLRYLVIAIVGDSIENTVVNMRSPIVINLANNQAMQVILEGEHYPLQYRLFAKDGDEES